MLLWIFSVYIYQARTLIDDDAIRASRYGGYQGKIWIDLLRFLLLEEVISFVL